MTEQADEAFRELMASRWPGMVRLAYGLTGDRGYAEDFAQTALAKAYASWGRWAARDLISACPILSVASAMIRICVYLSNQHGTRCWPSWPPPSPPR